MLREKAMFTDNYDFNLAEQGLLNWVYKDLRKRIPREFLGKFAAVYDFKNVIDNRYRTFHDQYWILDSNNRNSARIRALYELAFQEFQ